MKTDLQIKKNAVAAIMRSSKNEVMFPNTALVDDFPSMANPLPEELPVIYYTLDKDNWTLISTQRITGKIDAEDREIFFNNPVDHKWELLKDVRKPAMRLHISNSKGIRQDFLMESGTAKMFMLNGLMAVCRLTGFKLTN